jgi:transposase
VLIDAAKEAEILRLHHAEKWPIGTLASQLGVHHSTVRRVLAQAGVEAGRVMTRPSRIEPFLPFVRATLATYPTLRSSRLWVMVQERGYQGGTDHFRTLIARYRPRPAAEAFLRLRTLPGEQAQVDWGHFGSLQVGRAQRPLYGFVVVLSYARQIFLRFSLSAAMPSFVRGHVEAFAFFGGAPRVLLYDNLKSAVLERVGDVIRFHPTLLELAGHYRFQPRPVAPARGNEKGRVERAIQYIRHAFFAARSFADVDDLNAQALTWCQGEAADRPCPEERTRTVREVFADEQLKLLPLPQTPFDAEERIEVAVGKTPYVRFDRNDYSVPHAHVRRTLVVRATAERVRVLDGSSVVADHGRSWDRDQTVESPDHIAALVERKRRAREGRATERVTRLVPSSRSLLEHVAERGGSLGGVVVGLGRLLEREGPERLEQAVAEAVSRGTPHLGAVHQALDRAQHARGHPPAVSVPLPADARLEGLTVKPHALSSYDQLARPPEKGAKR